MLKRLLLVALSVCFFGVVAASADNITTYSSRTLFGGNDTAVWGPSSGADNTNLANPYSVTSSGGLGVTASLPAGDNMQLLTQGTGVTNWDGNFAPGDRVLFADGGSDALTITFDNPIYGVGFQMQQNVVGAFTGTLSAYDSSGTLLGTFSEAGDSNGNNDNSAIFLGLIDTSGANIAYITVSDAGDPSAGLAVNWLSLYDTSASVPEASTLFLLSIGLLGLAWLYRCKRDAQPKSIAA